MVGFYAGGPSTRGLSSKNITKFYRKALILGGVSPEESKNYTYHGGKRAGGTFQKAFDNA